MANKICKRMQDKFTDVIREIFPIRDIASRIRKNEKDTDEVFDTKEVTLKKKVSKDFLLSFQRFFYCPGCLLKINQFLFYFKSDNIFNKMRWES